MSAAVKRRLRLAILISMRETSERNVLGHSETSFEVETAGSDSSMREALVDVAKDRRVSSSLFALSACLSKKVPEVKSEARKMNAHLQQCPSITSFNVHVWLANKKQLNLTNDLLFDVHKATSLSIFLALDRRFVRLE